jgi:hypothetical protein
MWKALLVLALVGLFLGGSLMTLKYTARLGLPRGRRAQDDTASGSGGEAPRGHGTVNDASDDRRSNRAVRNR